jgi:hypothetical protein
MTTVYVHMYVHTSLIEVPRFKPESVTKVTSKQVI